MEILKPKYLILIIFGLILIDILGFVIIEHVGFFESLYFTIITLSTVGYGEVIKLTDAGRIWAIYVIISGVIGVVYSLRILVYYFFDIQRIRRNAMERKIKALKNHYIICGYGRMGSIICDHLATEKKRFIVIENNENKLAEMNEKGFLYLKGDATSDEILIKANIHRALGIVCVLSNDADNLYTTLTARALNPQIFILSRAIFEHSENKMKKAGANRVINPYKISGHKMTRALLSPHVDDFFEIVSRYNKIDLGIEEIHLYSNSEFVGKTLMESNIRKRFNVIITTIINRNGEMEFNPSPERELQANETLIALGKINDLLELKKLCEGIE